MRRYALLAALGLATGEDDDGAAAQPAIPWTKADAKQRMVAATSKELAPDAWSHFDGDNQWKSWEHAFPTQDAIDAWVNEPATEVPADA